MSQPQQHSVGTVHSQTYVIDYVADPLSSYFDVTHVTAHTLLLESAEIDSKDNLKSIMLLDAWRVPRCAASISSPIQRASSSPSQWPIRRSFSPSSFSVQSVLPKRPL